MRTKRSLIGKFYYFFKRGKEHWANIALIMTLASLVGIYRADITFWLGVPLHIFLIVAIPATFILILIVGWVDVTYGILADEMRYTALTANPISKENYERLRAVEDAIERIERLLSER